MAGLNTAATFSSPPRRRERFSPKPNHSPGIFMTDSNGVSVAAPARRARMLDQLASGQSIDHIAGTRNYTRRRVEKYVSAELKAISIRPARDYAKVQIRRLDVLVDKLTEKANGGDFNAIDRLLKVFDRLDRYHGFSSRSLPEIVEEANENRRLFKKILQALENHNAAQPNP
jgi:hypothetical protein